jgi:RNA polymerase sigma-70 factor (ECF subfamily)
VAGVPDGNGPCDDPDPIQLPDAVLARRAGLGDRVAFAELVHRHGPSLFGYALHMLDGDLQDAEDATQAAWIKAWQHIDGFRGQAALRTWLFRIMANEVHNSRRRRRPVAVDDSLLEPLPAHRHLEPESQLSSGELRQALEVALRELPWRQRASWLLREVEGLPYGEIADLLDTTPTVVRGQLHRARRTLAVRMVQWR